MKKILMKFTSRSRYDTLKKCVQAYFDMANNTNDMVWIFTIDEDDDNFQSMDFQEFLIGLGVNYQVFFGVSFSKIYAINRDIGLVKEDWDILLNISDDQLPIVKGYDDIIRGAMPEHLDCSLWFLDGHQSSIVTQEILGRKYYDSQGYVYYPAYKSFFCDNESTEVANMKNKLVKIDTCIIKHFHPVWGQNEHISEDDLYRRNDTYWNHDQSLYHFRKTNKFNHVQA
jgi:hypothetical protein